MLVRRARAYLWLAYGVLSLGGLGGCTDDGHDLPDFSVGMVAKWNQEPKSPAEVGVVFVLVVAQYQRDGQCRPVPPLAKIWANDLPLPLVPNPNHPGCYWATAEMGPFLKDQALTVQVREWSEVVAEARFTKLMPGTAATLEGTTGENLREGDPIVVRPVPEVPGEMGIAAFYPTDGTDWRPGGVGALVVERLIDGLHITVPAFKGPAVFVVWNTGKYLIPDVSCQGFAVCQGEASDVLGPFFVSGAL